MLDSVGLIHMNGRVYDPTLGRFLSADSVIQSLGATQSINPYSYAWNDPLRYTDPSGHSLLGTILGLVAAIIAIYLMQPEYFVEVGATLDASTAVVAGFVGGFVGAAISTGNLAAAFEAGVIGAITAGAFYGAGFVGNSSGSPWEVTENVLAHAAVGCGSAVLSGGNCGKGAMSAAIADAASPYVVKFPSLGQWSAAPEAAEAGLIGGVASRIEGGKFTDGFSVAAAGYLFNKLAHSLYSRPELSVSGNTLSGTVYVACRASGPQCSAIMNGLNSINGSGANGYTIDIKFVQTSAWPFSAGFWHGADLTITVHSFLASQDDEIGLHYGLTGRMIDLDTSFTGHAVAHEFGHFLGLADDYSNISDLMYYQGATGPTFPSQSDLESLVKRFKGK